MFQLPTRQSTLESDGLLPHSALVAVGFLEPRSMDIGRLYTHLSIHGRHNVARMDDQHSHSGPSS